MGRPRSENPLSARVSVRCTPQEKARLEEQAAAAGRRLADFARARLLGDPAGDVATVVKLLERTEVPRTGVAAMTDAEEAHPPRVRSKSTGRWWCPEAGCPSNGESKEERCPNHGTLMLRRG